MDFFQQQDTARRHTKWLVVYFVIAVAVMIATIYLVAVVVFTGVNSRHQHRFDGPPIQFALWNPRLFLGVSLGTLAVIFIGSAGKTMQLARGGSAVAAMFGARPVHSSTNDPDERKLLNVVEEMAIASGVPMPQVFVLDDENSINAFAAGHSTSDAAVTVTRGAMKMLSRDELQGVIGHEFSHILNGDMRLNLRLIGIIFGILCLTVIGRVLLRTGSGSRRGKNPLPLFGLGLILVGWVGVFFGRLIQAAVSRQREFLADASSVQFTRNPLGLSGALQKIGLDGYGSHIESPQAEQVSHMFFGNGISEPLFGLLATHPLISDRIHAIDPAWDGKFPPLKEEQFETVKSGALAQLDRQRSPLPGILGALLGGAIVAERAAARPTIRPQSVLPNLGQPTTAHLIYAANLRDSLPPALRDAVRDPLGAIAVIYGLLLSDNKATRQSQLTQLATRLPQPVYDETARLLADVAVVAARARLALANLALPGLRQLSAPQMEQFNDTIQFLITSDRQLDLFEYVLQKMVRRHLAPPQKSVVQFYSTKALLPDCAVLLSAIAHVGQEDEAVAESAFQRGAPYLRVPEPAVSLLPVSDCGLDKIDAALNRLAQAAPQTKKNLLEACAQTVAADGVIQEREAELLRAIADTLDCPIPPFVQME